MTCTVEEVERASAWEFCHAILPAVSRTFALNIPVLPARLRDAVCCAYLLCRIADTIEDAPELPDARRDVLYDALIRAVRETRTAEAAAMLADLRIGHAGYDRLMEGTGHVLSAYASLASEQRAAIADCVGEMIDGMRSSARPVSASGVRFVSEDFADLDRYCHYVAGTVGVMLTRLFATERPDAVALLSPAGRERGWRFGLGLQATNIIKDHAEDVARGVCFVPRVCVDAGSAGCAIRPDRRAALINHALGHLDCAMSYVLDIPADADGLRLFCLWALMLALGTLREAAAAGDGTPKVTRNEVATILDYSRRHVGDDAALRAWFAEGRTAVTSRLAGA